MTKTSKIGIILPLIQRKKWVINHILQRNVENKQQTMKGIIKKTDKGWNVLYTQCVPKRIVTEWNKSLPLHPDDVKQINKDAQVFDNIEARIAAYPEVEFDWCVIVQPDGKGKEYAKLINK